LRKSFILSFGLHPEAERQQSKYRYMNDNTAARRRNLEEKVPELEQTLQMVALLSEKTVCILHNTRDLFVVVALPLHRRKTDEVSGNAIGTKRIPRDYFRIERHPLCTGSRPPRPRGQPLARRESSAPSPAGHNLSY
jgi:hypothetical protein